MATSRSRSVWVAGGWVLATAAALLSAYTVALARLPQQRAAIESLVRSQTGYDLRFGRVAVRLGFYGPEAHFTDVQMWRPGGERRLLRATELIVRFETWRLLRSGSLRPGRILLVGAQIDAEALRPSQPPAAAAATAARDALPPEQRALQRLVAFARALPLGRIELESATLRGFERDESGGVTGRLVRIPRLSIQRTPDGARLQGNALLAERLGRSLFVAVELRGLDAGPDAIEGSIALQGRALRLAGWRAAFGGPAAGASGIGDLRAMLRLRDGGLQAGTLGIAASELRLPRADGTSQARFANVSTNAGFERQADGWRLRGSELRMVVPGAPAASLDYELDVDAAWSRVQFSADGVPFGWLRPLLALPAALDVDGTLRDLRLTTFATPAGRAVRYVARLDDGVWRDAGGQPRLEPLAFAIAGNDAEATIRFDERPLRLRLGDGPEQAQWLEIALQGAAALRREGPGWRLDSGSLVVLDRAAPTPRPRLELQGALSSAAPDSAALALEVVLLEPIASGELPLLRELSQRMLVAAPIDSFRLAAGRFAVDAASDPQQGWRIERSQGDLAVSAASFRPDADWPAVSEAGGRLVWDARDLRFDFERGAIGELRLVRGQLRRGRTPAWSLVAEGPVASALRVLAASPLATRVPAELRTAAIGGEARFELQVAPRPAGASAGTGRVDPLRWSLLARFGALRWQPLADVPPVEDLGGVLRIVDGRLQPARLEGRWLEQPLRIGVEERRAGRRWLLAGRLPGGPLRELLAEAYALDPSVAPRWRLEAQPARTDGQRWRVDFALDALPARGQFELAAVGQGFALRRGAVRLGAGGLRLPEDETMELSGDVAALDLALLARTWTTIAARGAAIPPLSGSVGVGRLDLLGEPLGAATLELGSTRGAPSLSFAGTQLAGVLMGADPDAVDSRPPRLELARLALERLPGRAALAASARESPWSLDLQVADLRLGVRRFGGWRGRLESSHERFAIEPMSLEAGGVGARGRLECLRNVLRCTLEARLAGGAARQALEVWGLQTGFDAERIEGALQLAWPVAAADDAWAALDGELRLSASDGVLDAPARLGLVTDAPAASWRWERLEIEARIGRGRADLGRIAFEGAQRLLLSGSVDLPSGRASLDGEWWPRRELPRALQDWPAAPALAAIWRAMRGEPVLPRAVRVTGTADALDLELLPLQSPAPP